MSSLASPSQHLARLSLDPEADGRAAVSPIELAELIAAFNEVTARLQLTHETLTGEVSRLQGELRDANQQLRRARELAALGEMAAGIAHEVRNPLGSIRLYASMLEEDLADRPEQRAVATRIADAVRGLNAIVSDVLAFAREIRVRSTPVELAELIERAAAACAGDASRADIEVETSCEDDVCAACDPSLTHQALVNVLRNAIEAAGDPEASAPRVHIEAAASQARDAQGGSRFMVGISVRDHGPGVSDDVMERMFNPFFTTRSAGTGLGLAIVHRIVDAHEGRVTVRNHEEGGAVVELLLPAASEDTNTAAETAAAHGGAR